LPKPIGIWIHGLRSRPPASMAQSVMCGFSVRRADSTHPADPAPTTMTSNSASNPNLLIAFATIALAGEVIAVTCLSTRLQNRHQNSGSTILMALGYFDSAVCKRRYICPGSRPRWSNSELVGLRIGYPFNSARRVWAYPKGLLIALFLYGNHLIFVYIGDTRSRAGGISTKRVAIYLRVSTSKQDTDNQRRELEAVAERSGWKVVKVYEDAGISGAKGRDQRPGLDAMLKAVNAKEFDMVASWSVDRLGRSLTDLLSILQGLHEKGVGLFLHQQGLDTTTSAGKAMFQMLGVFAEFERGIIRERVNAGLARARANGTKLGRRRVKPSVEARILELRAKGDGILKIGKKLGVGTSVVLRVFKEVPWKPDRSWRQEVTFKS
jgi:DNA invertase Pin-like site-specific DNA recombinase